MKKIFLFALMFSMLAGKSIAQQVSLTGKVINPDEKPIKKVLVYLSNNPSLYCYSDTLGNFLLTDISTSVTEVRQDKIISFENRKLSLYANNQSISVDVITVSGNPILNILNLNHCLGTFSLFPEAYLSDLPKAIYIVMARVGNTFQSFKIQNIIPSGFPQGITEYDINNIIDNCLTEPKSEPNIETKSEALDTLVLVHDFYKSRKIPISSYSIQYDTIHLNNFADYSIAEGFEPSVTYMFNKYANFTDIFSADSVQFIIDYDSLSVLKGDLKIISIPVDKIENLDNSIKFISGLHFEPSGTKFFQPVQVSVLMKDSIPENLVVFHCNDQGETYYIPYVSHESYYVHRIIFNINHFSSIGIGTGKIPAKSDPSEFTTSDQFISYMASYAPNFDAIPKELITIWFNNVVAPMISKIITWEDFGAALGEFLLMAETCAQFGICSTDSTDLPFYGSAREMFCEKMMKIWNECIVEYNGLDDKCLKRAILDIALSILEQNALMGGWCTDLSHPNLSDMNAFGNGEFFNLASGIEFSTPVKHLEVGGSYIVQYTLKSITGDTASIPEVVIWSSSNPSVATIDANGKVIALKDGVTTIKGKICDIENTFGVGVGECNCEENYCYNELGCCYSGTYKCTGVLHWTYNDPEAQCGDQRGIERYTIVSNLDLDINSKRYFGTITDFEYEEPNPYEEGCHWNYEHYFNSDPVCGFWCGGIAYFPFNAQGDVPEFYGYLKGDSLIVVGEKVVNYIPFVTKMQCVRIDK